MKKKTENIALDELLRMLPFVLAANAAVLAVLIAYGAFNGFEWRDFTGLAVGNVIFAANFLLIGVTSGSVLRRRNEKKAQQLANISYGVRYVGMFAVLSLLLILKVITPIPALMPLFYPRLYYTFYSIFTKGKDDF